MNNNWDNDKEYYASLKTLVEFIIKDLNRVNNNLIIPILKEVYWKFPKKEIPNTRFTTQLKYFLKFLLNFKFKKNEGSFIVIEPKKRNVLIFIDDESLYYLYEPLIKRLISQFNVFSFCFKEKDGLNQFLLNQGIQHLSIYKNNINQGVSINELFLSLRYLFSSLNLEALYKVIESKNVVFQNIHFIQKVIKKTSPKIALLNVSENTSFGYLFSEFGSKNNFHTLNLQNGWRSKMSINGDTNFSAWFVHNKLMEKVLVESGVPPKQLIVTGHLFTEIAEKTTIKNTFEKKVLLIFSSFVYLKEQEDLVDCISKNRSFFEGYDILIRLHPREDPQKNIFLKKGFKQFYSKNKKAIFTDSLIEAFQISDFSISFGSFVSFQAHLVNKPNLNIEYRPKSTLNFIEPLELPHASSKNEIEGELKKMGDRKVTNSNMAHISNASEIMMQEVLKFIEK